VFDIQYRYLPVFVLAISLAFDGLSFLHYKHIITEWVSQYLSRHSLSRLIYQQEKTAAASAVAGQDPNAEKQTSQ
jgi:hypothetical protein